VTDQTISFQKAERKKSKLRLALFGAAGSGKTLSALLLASGLKEDCKIAVVDTENGSAEIYADRAKFDVINFSPPYTPDKFIDAIHTAEREGYDVLIIDTISAMWSGEGGLLDIKQRIEKRGGGNSFTAWAQCTPIFNRFVDAILQSSIHIICTMRSKAEYTVMKDPNGGIKGIAKVGTTPIQRGEIDYNFTTVFHLDRENNAVVTKDRTSMFNTVVPFRITEETGRLIAEWLNVGSPMKPSRKEEKSKSEEEEEATYEEPKDLPEDQEEPGADLF
jgi:hypothetical protein